MITLHTLTNEYDGSDLDYHQFVQSGKQPLLESQALHSQQNLREFLISDVVEACDAEDEEVASMHQALEAGDINELLCLAEQIHTGFGETASCMTGFGSWEFDSVIIEPPTLRELQVDTWAEDPAYPRRDWQEEIYNDGSTLGYWEWVEHRREMALYPPGGDYSASQATLERGARVVDGSAVLSCLSEAQISLTQSTDTAT